MIASMTPEERIQELEAENATLRRGVEQLRAEYADLQQQLRTALDKIAELERRKKEPPAFVKPKRHKEGKATGERKKRAAEHNTSRKRGTPTRIERHALECCPHCQHELQKKSVAYTREVLELPMPQPVEIIEHQVIRGWCPCCHVWRSPQLDLQGQVFGQGRIGMRIAGLVVYLRTKLRLPVRSIQAYLKTLHGLSLSVGEIVELTHAVSEQLQPQVEALKTELHESKVVHADETGWREAGDNGYCWGFMTTGPEAVHYFEYDGSRGHWVPERILGRPFRGYLVTDFYSAYNLLRLRHQRCWVHLLRALHELKESYPDHVEVSPWATAVHQVYTDAQAWLKEHPDPTGQERRDEYRHLFRRACVLGQQYALQYEHPCCTLAKRLLRHQDELFRFVLVPGMAADNNLAERSLRPLVIMRKISGGSRSPKGTKTRLALFSLFSTWAARGQEPFQYCLSLLQAPVVSAPT
jgi:transposase